MHARVTTLRGRADELEEGIAQYRDLLPTFRAIPGNKGAFLLVGRDAERAIGVTLWESEQAAAESRERANELRERAVQEMRGQLESVDEFEVAVWDV
jgi:heme-degrading monooxygenase HmoA